MDIIINILVFVFILSALVLIHEAGHYFVAKFFGIKVEEFGWGIPPRAFGKKFGETIYSINWLPFGGFVKLYGEDEAGGGSVSSQKDLTNIKDAKRAFFSRPVYQRALVVVAGVFMNLILAFFVYYLFMGLSGFKTELPLLTNHHFFGVNQSKKIDTTIADVAPKSPAEKSGIKKFSKVISVDGKEIKSVETFQKIITLNKGRNLDIKLQNMQTNDLYTVHVTPRMNPPKGQGALGVAFGIPVVVLSYDTPAQKIFSGITHPLNLTAYNYDVLKSLISVSVKDKNPGLAGEAVGGPVMIFKVVGDLLHLPPKEAFIQLLNLTGLLSMSLAIFNVLPIPALDGGRLFFILIEGITRKKLNPNVEGYIHQVGMTVLLILIALVTFKDVFQLFK
jgi:regulator of sigma E protease